MAWLASLDIKWLLIIAFAMVFLRLGLRAVRSWIGKKAETYTGEFIESLLCAWVVVFLFVKPLLFEQFSIPSRSMVPTLMVGDRIVVNKYGYRLRPPQRGDIVVFESPPAANKDEVDFVKRLIGLPGDVVDLRDGKVFLNGEPINEPYLFEQNVTTEEPGHVGSIHFPYRISEGYYLVFGDNRRDSFDSRGWGAVEIDRIKGKAVLKLWPLNAFGLLH